jgi:hypothetical protein
VDEEEAQDYITQGGSASLQYDMDFQSRKVSLRDIKIRSDMRDNGEWFEASSGSSWHFGYGRSVEAAIVSLLARVMGVDPDEVG